VFSKHTNQTRSAKIKNFPIVVTPNPGHLVLQLLKPAYLLPHYIDLVGNKQKI